MDALYVTYNGLLSPIGQSQILPYLKGLARQGERIGVVSFENRASGTQKIQRKTLKNDLRELGIGWMDLRYHRSPSIFLKAMDLISGMLAVFCACLRWRPRLLHARSAVAGVMAWPTVWVFKRKFLFDLRGLNAEEYVDGSHWSREGLRYRILKRWEAHLLRCADEVVVLTENVRGLLREGQYLPDLGEASMTVIPCCVDLDLFRRPIVEEKGPSPENSPFPIFVYSGSLGSWYLLREMLDFFRTTLKRWPSACLWLLTPSDPQMARPLLSDLQIPSDRVKMSFVSYPRLPEYLTQADVGLCFIKPSLSKRSSSPTKMGEYLASGLAVVANAGVGDLDRLMGRYRIGVVLHQLSTAAYSQAVDEVEGLLQNRQELRKRCREVAEKELSLEWAVQQYKTIYQKLQS